MRAEAISGAPPRARAAPRVRWVVVVAGGPTCGTVHAAVYNQLRNVRGYIPIDYAFESRQGSKRLISGRQAVPSSW